VIASLAFALADIQTEGRDVVVGMLIVGLVIVGVIVLGELAGWMAHRLVALRLLRDVAERVALDDLRQLGPRADDHVDVEPEAVGDQLLAPRRQPGRALAGREHDVPALHVRAHVFVAGLLEQLAQLRHRDAVARADVDATEQDDLRRHQPTVTAMRPLPNASWARWLLACRPSS